MLAGDHARSMTAHATQDGECRVETQSMLSPADDRLAIGRAAWQNKSSYTPVFCLRQVRSFLLDSAIFLLPIFSPRRIEEYGRRHGW